MKPLARRMVARPRRYGPGPRYRSAPRDPWDRDDGTGGDMDGLHRVERSEVDGVPTFRVDTPGPAFAMLQFRVGRVDEPLTHAGITHLVEHLAFHRLLHLSYEHNGTTEPSFTRFFAEGDTDEVADFVRTVVATLTDPPLDRIGREARILGEEAAGRDNEALDLLWRSRYGASAHGRPGYPEFGLWWLDAEAVGAWLVERFTRDNAALVLAGPVAEDLGLDRLPRGRRFPLPEVEVLDLPAPRHVHGPDGIVLGTLLTPRSVEAGLTHAVLEREVEQRLRHEHGLVYETITEGSPLDLTTRELLVGGLVRDAAPAGKVTTLLGQMLDELGERGPDPALLDSARRRMLRQYRDPVAAVGSAVHAAECELTGYPDRPIAEDVETLEATTPAAIAEVVAEARGTFLLAVPEEVDVDDDVFGPCERALPLDQRERAESDPPLTGETFREARIGRRRASLVVGDEAVGLRFGDGNWWRLAYDDVAAACWYEDGARELMTRDGLVFPITPPDFRRGDAAVAAVDARLPREVFTPALSDGSVPEERLPRTPDA